MKTILTAAQVKPGDVLVRTRISGGSDRRTVRAVQENTFVHAPSRYGFVIEPHGDFIGWFSAASVFNIERD